MGSNLSILLQKDEIELISSETGFTPKQIKRLYSRFTNLDKNNLGYLTRHDFARIPELHVNPLRDRIIEVLIDDYGQDEKINFRQFAKVMSIFNQNDIDSNDNKEKKLRFLFSFYDRDKDENINKTELIGIISMLVGNNLSNELISGIADRTLNDYGADGFISYQMFKQALGKRISIDDKMNIKFLT